MCVWCPLKQSKHVTNCVIAHLMANQDQDIDRFCDKDGEFPINVDLVWKYFGYSTKGSAVRYLKSHFKEGASSGGGSWECFVLCT